MLLEAQRPKSSASIAVETGGWGRGQRVEDWSATCWQAAPNLLFVFSGASLLWEPRPQHEETPPTSPYLRPAADMTGQEVEGSPSGGSR